MKVCVASGVIYKSHVLSVGEYVINLISNGVLSFMSIFHNQGAVRGCPCGSVGHLVLKGSVGQEEIIFGGKFDETGAVVVGDISFGEMAKDSGGLSVII